MRWIDLLRLSAQNLWRRKLRTVLTMVGVMIGTASIVVMVSMGIGINQGYIDSLSETGELTRIELYSQVYYGNSGALVYLDDETTVKAEKFDDAMIRKIRALDHVKSVTPLMDLYNFKIRTGKLESYYSLIAIMPEAIETLGYEFTEGGGFTGTSGETVELLLGENTLRSFRKPNSQIWSDEAPDLDWLNEKYTLVLQDYNEIDDEGNPKEYEFKARVVGIVKDNGSGDAPYNIYANLEAVQRIVQKHKSVFKNSDIKTDQYQRGYVKVDDFNNALEVQKQIKEMGLDAWSYAQMIESMQEQSRSLQLMLGGIGAVAMLVAAISIANTMLMSIYERTREIGVMKVLGCRMSSIGAMFLCEAAIIGLGGGLIGLGLSYGISVVINIFMGASGAYGSFRSVIPVWLAAGGVAFAALVGLLSGLYPSQRAMRLSALAAIRNE